MIITAAASSLTLAMLLWSTCALPPRALVCEIRGSHHATWASRQEGGELTASEPFRKTVIARFFKANGTTQLIAVLAMSDSVNDQPAHRIDRIAGTTLAHATG
jgi:hypothetical protein